MKRPVRVALALAAAVAVTGLSFVLVSYFSAPHFSDEQTAYVSQVLEDTTGWKVTSTEEFECNILEKIKKGDLIAYPMSGACREDFSFLSIGFETTGLTHEEDIHHVIRAAAKGTVAKLTGPRRGDIYGDFVAADGTFTLPDGSVAELYCESGTNEYSGENLYCSVVIR